MSTVYRPIAGVGVVHDRGTPCRENAQLEKSLDELVESINRLGAALITRHQEAVVSLTEKIRAGAPVSEALAHTGEPTLRSCWRRLWSSFTGARNRTRVKLLSSAIGEGEAVPDVRRALHPPRPMAAAPRRDGAVPPSP